MNNEPAGTAPPAPAGEGNARWWKLGTWSTTQKIAGAGVLAAVVIPLAVPFIEAALGTDDATDGQPGAATVRIENTWEEKVKANIGVKYYKNPYNTEGAREGFGLQEGDTAVVVCQVRDGRLVRDTPHEGRQTESRVWDKLENGLFIPDMYTDLPKVVGAEPPADIPRC